MKIELEDLERILRQMNYCLEKKERIFEGKIYVDYTWMSLNTDMMLPNIEYSRLKEDVSGVDGLGIAALWFVSLTHAFKNGLFCERGDE